ncbi:tRNA (adenosine(37)-N6)-threonylcarbamoyltransferase complex dimerization subunit type 1 TsaB [Mycoplasmopsis columboralis]|uniref:Molecular chaperone n=1 Tax=Mycoplasmopsis columboralis TaxID=171282 RepID=A0A449B745_9BACT|nr:tRNA (adenosine(37)-N6)-threonylcarbamoyltransferase complex dimerization subunit type 1 TsaB [Mycoplasmopsis columboralis]VEU76403.1 molecular chaperone [Mycoplasmopsis columboralis]
MNVYLDTCADDLVLILFDDTFKVKDHLLISGVKKKVELLTIKFDELLQRNNLNVNNIDKFYLNKGPGFFTGVRIALVFARTIALWNNKLILTTNSFAILSKQQSKEMYLLNASGLKQYALTHKELISAKNEDIHRYIQVVDKLGQEDKINYTDMIENFANYQDIFEVENTIDIVPLYVKMPQIGDL